jgi:hypothetical protein
MVLGVVVVEVLVVQLWMKLLVPGKGEVELPYLLEGEEG